VWACASSSAARLNWLGSVSWLCIGLSTSVDLPAVARVNPIPLPPGYLCNQNSGQAFTLEINNPQHNRGKIMDGKLKLALGAALLCCAAQSWAINTTGWTCSGGLVGAAGAADVACGQLISDGVVGPAPVVGSTGYAWVASVNATGAAPATVPQAIINSMTAGGLDTSSIQTPATYTSAPFTVAASGTPLSFYFNYVTTDGSTSYADFAWARLLDGLGNPVALLFTARTTNDPTESAVPGSNMPPVQATLSPASVPIQAPGYVGGGAGPVWSPLNASGSCYAIGCGYSGWIRANYVIANPGTYRLEIGVANWQDDGYDSGLAIDGLLVGGIDPTDVNLNPASVPALNGFALGALGLALVLAGVGAQRARSKRA
jgi:hypothetical protein